jgi:hypothetical protein
MTRKICKIFGVFSIAFYILAFSNPILGQSSSSFCSESVIPSEMLKQVKSIFPGWRIKTVEDLEPNHQIMWRENRFLDCPGIVKGNFQGTHNLGFGIMLVQDLHEGKGFKVIVMTQPGRNAKPKLTVLRDEKDLDPERFVIYQAPKGNYSDPDNKEKINIQYDGIYLEDLEMGSTLFFWKDKHFEKWVVVR